MSRSAFTVSKVSTSIHSSGDQVITAGTTTTILPHRDDLPTSITSQKAQCRYDQQQRLISVNYDDYLSTLTTLENHEIYIKALLGEVYRQKNKALLQTATTRFSSGGDHLLSSATTTVENELLLGEPTTEEELDPIRAKHLRRRTLRRVKKVLTLELSHCADHFSLIRLRRASNEKSVVDSAVAPDTQDLSSSASSSEQQQLQNFDTADPYLRILRHIHSQGYFNNKTSGPLAFSSSTAGTVAAL